MRGTDENDGEMSFRCKMGILTGVVVLIFLLCVVPEKNYFTFFVIRLSPDRTINYEKATDGVGEVYGHPLRLRQKTNRSFSDEDFHSFLMSPEMVCTNSYRAGRKGDGGWDVCLSAPYFPRKPCLVYSFGINYDFTFDDAMARTFNCTVKSYDPSMSTASHQRSSNVHFYKEGLSGRDYVNSLGWNLYSLSSILKRQNHTNAIIDYFKMDIEDSEWDALPTMAAAGLLNNIKQIGFELHRPRGLTTKAFNLLMILEQHGFKKWKMHYNPSGTYLLPKLGITSKAIELCYVNTRFLKGKV